MTNALLRVPAWHSTPVRWLHRDQGAAHVAGSQNDIVNPCAYFSFIPVEQPDRSVCPGDLELPDFYRVNYQVRKLRPFVCLAFPLLTSRKKPPKCPSSGDELVRSLPAV